MNVATWSIRRPVPAIILFVLLTLAGIISFYKLSVQAMPDIDLPGITITAVLPGASPSQMETEVTRQIENAVSTVQGVQHIFSSITNGMSVTTVQFVLEKNINEAVNDTRDAITRTRGNLPSHLAEPLISKIDTAGGQPILTFALPIGRSNEETLSWFVDNTISRALLTVPGVGSVTRLGGLKREIQVDINPARLEEQNVSILSVATQLKRMQMDMAGGKGHINDVEQYVNVSSPITSVSELAQMKLALGDGRYVKLGQLATIKDTAADRTQLVLLDGKPAIGFQIERSRGYSEVSTAQKVNQALQKLELANPEIQIVKVNDTTLATYDQYEDSIHILFEGSLLAVVVVGCFLKNSRATLISAIALPLSIIPTFIVMFYLGYSLNAVTLLGLILVIGFLVDDAIVEVENIVRHLGMGKSPIEAAKDAVNEIGLAVVATTLALVAVFLPTAFLGGVSGKLFSQFGWTVSVAVLASLLVARLLTPMMAAYLLKPYYVKENEDSDNIWMHRYLNIVRSCLRHRHLTLFSAIVFFIASLSLISVLSVTYIPPSDLSFTKINLELDPRSSLADTHTVTDEVQKKLSTIPEVSKVLTIIGSGSENYKADMVVILKPRYERERSQQAIEKMLRSKLENIPGVRFHVGLDENGGKFHMAFTSTNPAILDKTIYDIEQAMHNVSGLTNISSSLHVLQPEIIVMPDPVRAAELGITIDSIAETVHAALSGDFETSLAKLNLPDRQVNIRVRLSPELRQNLDELQQLKISGEKGLVSLGNVATLKMSNHPAKITYYDRNKGVIIDADLVGNGQQLGDILKHIDALPVLRHLPKEIHRIDIGESEQLEELLNHFGIAVISGVLCIYFILVLLFNNFFLPITILTAIPLSVGGAFFALLITHQSISMPSLIGLIMLMGITTKNSILLVEYAMIAIRDGGASELEALSDACYKRTRPIIMTSCAMGAGMIPLALGFGSDPSFRSPMAIAVIGGLVTSTILSLVIVPVVFTYVHRLEKRIKQMFIPPT